MPECPNCGVPRENVHHHLLKCPSYNHEQHMLRNALGQHTNSIQYLVNMEKGIKEILKYVG
jgi:hypothetical protein